MDKGKSSSGRRTADSGGEVFQIATGVETSILELAVLVQEVVGRDVGVQHGPPRQGDIRKNYSAIAKVRQVLGWEPRMGLLDGLRETWEWFEDRRGSKGKRTSGDQRASAKSAFHYHNLPSYINESGVHGTSIHG